MYIQLPHRFSQHEIEIARVELKSTTGDVIMESRTETNGQEWKPIWPWWVFLSIIVVTLMVSNGISQSFVAIVANVLLAVCIVSLILDRRQRSKTRTSEQGVWVDYDKAQGIAFLIAPIGNAADTEKLISLAADDLRPQRDISSAVFVKAMIGTVLLDWRGLTHEGKRSTSARRTPDYCCHGLWKFVTLLARKQWSWTIRPSRPLCPPGQNSYRRKNWQAVQRG